MASTENGNTLKVTTALSLTDNYIALREDASLLQQSLAANLGGTKVDRFDLVNVKVPAGGGTQWQIEDVEGAEHVTELNGVVVTCHDYRAYWKVSFDEGGGGTPPDCASNNAKNGEGNPGGDCFVCPLGQFGSDKRGRGQACKLGRILYILREDSFIPLVLRVPTGSVKTIRRYFLGLANKGVPFHNVLSSFTLQQAKNQDGIPYSQIQARMLGRLDPETIQRIAGYMEIIQPHLNTAAHDPIPGDFE